METVQPRASATMEENSDSPTEVKPLSAEPEPEPGFRPPRRHHSAGAIVDGPSMLSRRMSFSAVSQQAGRSLRRPLSRIKSRVRTLLVHSAIPSMPEDDEDAQPRGILDGCCSVDDILRADSPPPVSGVDYPQFDSLEAYAITESKSMSDTLWRNEARRLLHYVSKPDAPVRFKNREFFKTGDEDGHKALAAMTEKIFTAMSLCVLDNECITTRHSPKASSRSRLKKLIIQASVAADTYDETEPKDPSAHEREQDAMFDLVDYISVILARLITQTGTGSYWQASVLCALVKRVAKIKIMLIDLAANASLAAQEGEAVFEHSRDSRNVTASMIEEEEECEEILRLIAAETAEGLTSISDAQVATYCVNQGKVRSGLDILMRSMVMPLRSLNKTGLGDATYEICGLVYETGFQGFKTLLFQDRELEFSATSDLDNLNTADSAFALLNQTVRHLKMLSRSDPSNAVTKRRVKTFIEWTHHVAAPGETDVHEKKLDSLELEFMDDIISVMVPLATTKPKMVSELNSFRSIMLLSKENRDPVRMYEETSFSAFFRLYTNTFEDEASSQNTLRLKAAFENGSFERYRLISPLDKDVYSNTNRFDECARTMDSEWVMDECSVVVPCATYVLSVMGVAIALAAGGLTIGFTLGDRIEAVDPFQFASYAWILAAFVILISKSVLVREWSWSDFLHCRVRCRSVSELAAVTGFQAQIIIAKLLHEDSGGGILCTRGPYNSVFLRRSSDGFSIDEPLSTSTMLMSGLMPLKVVTPKGQALVCLDSRRGTRLRVVDHQSDPKEQYLVCEHVSRLQRLAREGDGQENKAKATRLQLLLSREVRWKRVLGVYNARDVVFV